MRSYPKIFVFALLINVVALLGGIVSGIFGNPAADEVVLNEAKLQALKPLLPTQSVVGYLTDNEVTKGGSLRLDACRRFYMTQYALAPTIVVHDTKENLIVGNFTSPEMAHKTVAESNLPVVKDFGDGVILLRRQAKP